MCNARKIKIKQEQNYIIKTRTLQGVYGERDVRLSRALGLAYRDPIYVCFLNSKWWGWTNKEGMLREKYPWALIFRPMCVGGKGEWIRFISIYLFHSKTLIPLFIQSPHSKSLCHVGGREATHLSLKPPPLKYLCPSLSIFWLDFIWNSTHHPNHTHYFKNPNFLNTN